ncbi:SMP-30/gluconolactonase/LRE family protein [Pseudomonas izuensis]|uniref:SMP-30/gluconolactonase/LRE family protein n=1 Tax=Pseudomonas izuensis TaxID=2684212 RepID=A0ABM7S1P6_9PSED|nr:SMP-30/gluconolactonase/LRE family protein [Pseudomonas izuensis]BCX68242.1 SMP-30/gluconolactonase/LRE family protein [Pseudomonas izuensis]
MFDIRLASAAFALAVSSAAYAAPPEVPACVAQSDYTPICGMAPAEDLELSPDGRFLFLSTTPGLAASHRSRLRVMELASRTVTDMVIERQATAGWGEPSCEAPQGTVGAHGIHLSKRADGRSQLLVVNHNGREAVEFFEPKSDGISWKAIWRGCVESHDGTMLNDVAATAGGGFVVTAMFSFKALKDDPRLDQLLDGRDTGHLLAWHPSEGLHRLPNSQAPAPNGIQVSPDGQSLWFAAWPGRGVWQYDLKQQKVVSKIALNFLPDNLTSAANGQLLTAGVPDKETFRRCFLRHDEFCPSATVVALINPLMGSSRELLRAREGALYGASTALQVGRDVFVGAFAGDRLLLLPEALPAF